MRKVLVIRLSSIGDIVLTTPVLRCIKKSFPDSELHYLSKASYETLLKPNPFIDKLIFWKGRKTIKTIQAEKYDVVIDLHKNLRTSRIKWSLFLSKGRMRWKAFDKINIQKWLSVRFKSTKPLPQKHIVFRYLKPALELGVAYDNKGLDFFIEAKHRVNISSNFEGLQPYDYYVYAIGGQHETKKLPKKKQIELLTNINVPIILIGGKEDMQRGAELASLSNSIYNACGAFSIQQSASLIEQSRKVISHDTGMMHIAAAFLKPIISIWGNTIPEFGMYPFYPKNFHDYENRVLEVKDVFCRPCSKIGYSSCPWGHFKCMNGQDLSQVH